MFDIRLKNLARDLIKPQTHKGIKTRNLKYLKLVMAPKNKCAVFATFPASGANWTDDITGYVISKTFKGQHGITFDNNARTLKSATSASYPFISPADARTINVAPIKDSFPELGLDYMFHTHGHWKESGLWGLDAAKTGMITRHLPTALYSYTSKRRDIYATPEECFEKTKIVERAIYFYNSWNKYRLLYPNRFYNFKYEECRKDPVNQFSSYLKFMFDRDFDHSVIEEALDFFSFEKQKERESLYNKDDKKHFHYKGKTSYKDEMSAETYSALLKKIISELDHDFGYDYRAELEAL